MFTAEGCRPGNRTNILLFILNILYYKCERLWGYMYECLLLFQANYWTDLHEIWYRDDV